jgi:signal transduction histidine kinase
VVFLTAHNLVELAARVRAALRRAGREATVGSSGVRLDPVAHVLRVQGRDVPLTPTEFRLMACVMAAPGTVVRRRTLRGRLALLALATTAARAVAGRALQSVGAMSAQAGEWGDHDTSLRLGTRERPRELAHLAGNLDGNLDGLLDRLAALIRHEQQLTAELSHELRTPLTRITAEAEWLTARPRSRAEQAASHEAIAASAAAMAQICQTLLADARAGSTDPGRCAPGEVAASLAQRRAEAAPDAVPVTVEGRSVPADLGPAVFDPGRRADPADGHDGAGLGLALARRLARNAGGDMTLAETPGPTGGAHFVITLPGVRSGDGSGRRGC